MRLPKLFKSSRSIAGKLTRNVMLAVFLVFTIITAVIAAIAWFLFLFLGVLFFETTIEKSNQQTNAFFMAIEVAINNTSPNVSQKLDKPEELYQVVEQVLLLNPNIVGAAIAFEPDYFPKKGTWFAPYAYRSDGEIKTKQLGTPDYLYHDMEWYHTPKEQGKPYWSEPYFDEGGGNMLMTTYSLPLSDSNGKFYAVLTADISLDWLTDMIHRTDSISNAEQLVDTAEEPIYSFIIGREGKYIVHPDKELILGETFLSHCLKTKSTEDDRMAYDMLAGKKDYNFFYDGDKLIWGFYGPLERTGWSMCTIIPSSEFLEPANIGGLFALVLLVLGQLIVAFVSWMRIKKIIKPLTKFADSADQIAEGKFDAPLPEIKSKDEMRRLHDSFQSMQQSLINQIEETQKVNMQKGRIEGELDAAREIQMSMIPKTFPPYPDRNDIDIFGMLRPAKEVGGDLYDFFVRDEKLFFCIGDVSGKGVPAALVMAVTRAQFRNISMHESHPERIVTLINDAMSENNESNMFVTFFMGSLDLPTGRLRYVNAGHDAPLIISDKEEEKEWLDVEANIPIGLELGWKYKCQETTISPGTTIFLYTDGLTEAEDCSHRLFGEERIKQSANCKEPPAILIDTMLQAVNEFVGNAEQSDDLTMLAIKYTKQQLESHLKRSITLQNDIEQVPELAAFIDGFCEELGLDPSLTTSLNLALEEAVVNSMNYAYPAGTKGNIIVEAQANAERLRFTISDEGIPFDPTAASEVDTELSAEERPIGGLGVHLFRQIMDSINYERVGGRNILTLRKKLK